LGIGDWGFGVGPHAPGPQPPTPKIEVNIF